MNYKTRSCKYIVQKVFRDLKPTDSSWTTDAIEWIGEVLEYISVNPILERKAKELNITNFRSSLPLDLMHINQVEYNGVALPYGTDTSAHDLPNAPSTTNAQHYNHDGVATAAFTTNPNSTNRDYNETFYQRKHVRNSQNRTDYYVLNPNYIQTSFEEGTIKIHYSAVPVDDCGYPMVPDNVYFSEACFWYILKKMLMGGYTNPIFNYEYASNKWDEYCIKAGNDLMFPSVDKIEAMKNQWVRLIPNINFHADFFKGMGDTQENLDR